MKNQSIKNFGRGQEEESPEPIVAPTIPAVEPATTPEPKVTPFSPTIQPETTPKG